MKVPTASTNVTSSWSTRCGINQWTSVKSPFRARGLLVNQDNGAVDESVLQIGIPTEGLEQILKHTAGGPPPEGAELTVPLAKARGSIPPKRTSTHTSEHGFEKQTVVPGCKAGTPGLA